MSTERTYYRIRNNDTGEFFVGGMCCYFNKKGKAYQNIGAAKSGWNWLKKYTDFYTRTGRELPNCSIVATRCVEEDVVVQALT